MIYKAKWVLPITSDPIEDGEVLVCGEKIGAVGTELGKLHPRERTRDLGEVILAPGFVSAHSHLDYTFLRGAIDDLPLFPWVRRLSDYARACTTDDFRWSSLLGAAECLQAGITTVADASFSGMSLDALLESGLRGVVYQEVFGYRNADFSPEMDVLKARLDDLVAKTTGRVKAGISPHSIYTVSPGLFSAVRGLAHEASLPISIHVAESTSEYDFCKNGTGEIAELYNSVGVEWQCPGVSPVQYLYDLGLLGEQTVAAHCVQVDENDIRLLAVTRTGLAHCPRSNAKLGVGVALIPSMLRFGVRLGLGTDSAVSSGTLDICEEARVAALLQRARQDAPTFLEARTLVEVATMGGAKSLGMDQEIGSIEVGKKADLTAVDVSGPSTSPVRDPYSTLAYCASARDVKLTMVDGSILLDRGKLKTLDLPEIKTKAGEAAKRFA